MENLFWIWIKDMDVFCNHKIILSQEQKGQEKIIVYFSKKLAKDYCRD